MPKYAKQVDRNHEAIRDGLRQLGFIVEDCSRVGNGFSDLVVKHPNKTGFFRFVEVKMPKEKLTEKEEKFQARWADEYLIAYEIEDVLREFEMI